MLLKQILITFIILNLSASCGKSSQKSFNTDSFENDSNEIKSDFDFPLMDYDSTFNSYLEAEADATEIPSNYNLMLSDEKKLPSSYYNLIKYQTNVKYQGQRGQCHNFATTGAMEYVLKRREGKKFDLSEQCNAWKFFKECYNCNGNPENKTGDGGKPWLEIPFIKNKFMKLESDGGYQTTHSKAGNCKDSYNDGEKVELRNIKSSSIGSGNVEWIKKSLTNRSVVVSSVFWMKNKTNMWGEFPFQKNYEDCDREKNNCGGHAVIIVAYDDNYYGKGNGGFIFKNSWSRLWGLARITVNKPFGYGVFPYTYVEKFLFSGVAVSSSI